MKTNTFVYYFMEVMIFSAMTIAFTMAAIIAKNQVSLILGA